MHFQTKPLNPLLWYMMSDALFWQMFAELVTNLSTKGITQGHGFESTFIQYAHSCCPHTCNTGTTGKIHGGILSTRTVRPIQHYRVRGSDKYQTWPWWFTFVDKFVINKSDLSTKLNNQRLRVRISRDVRRVGNKLINKIIFFSTWRSPLADFLRNSQFWLA